MNPDKDIAYLVTTEIVRHHLLGKSVVVSITDGKSIWRFNNGTTFTIEELRKRFPYFNKKKV